jgi:hypothetical protein
MAAGLVMTAEDARKLMILVWFFDLKFLYEFAADW